MKQLDDHIGSIYDHYLSTRNCPPDFHGLHEHLYFHHEVRCIINVDMPWMLQRISQLQSFLIINLIILCR